MSGDPVAPPKKPRGSAAQVAKLHACEDRCKQLDREKRSAEEDARNARVGTNIAQSELQRERQRKAAQKYRVHVPSQVFGPYTFEQAEEKRAKLAGNGAVCGVEFIE